MGPQLKVRLLSGYAAIMTGQSPEIATGRLERSCRHGEARIRAGAVSEGIAWAEAFFRDRAFAPHRHDSYAIGLTLTGVRTFAYRGEGRRCLPGDLHVLHPDETHDGAPGSEAGFGYRILYVDPALVGAALGRASLPFVGDPVVAGSGAPARGLAAVIAGADEGLDEVSANDLVVALAEGLSTLAAGTREARSAIDGIAVASVRAALMEEGSEGTPMAALEVVAGLDRWTLTRQFRAAYGTSPHRFRTMRRLERARRLMQAGTGLAEASAAAGFADQSHMTRQFKRAYGLTPARWLAALAAA
jgi:AraC-like DNA-binding protein